MGLYVNPYGERVEIDDSLGQMLGWTPVQSQAAATISPEAMAQFASQWGPILQSGNVTSDQLAMIGPQLEQFGQAQTAAADKVMKAAPGYVMTPTEYSLIFAKPYQGEDLASLTSGWTTQQRQSIESQNKRTDMTEAGIMAALAAAGGAIVAGAGGVAGAGSEALGGFGEGALGSWDAVGGLTAAEQAALGGGTGAFDMGASAGVFDSAGNPLYQSPPLSVAPPSGAIETGGGSVGNEVGGATPMSETGAFDMNASQGVFDSYGNPLYNTAAGSSSAALFPGFTEFLKANPWALPLAGTLLGGLTSGGTQSQTTSTTTAQPPSQVSGALSGAASLLPGGASAGGSLAGSPNNLGLAGQSLAETMLGNFMLPSAWNPYGGQTTQVPTNPYYGQDNPYLQGVIDRSAGDVTARIQSQFNKPGGYGGSANQEILARELGNLNNQIRYQDYGLQANLGEQDVNRRLSTSLADLTRNAGLWQNDMARNTANYQAERGRQLSAALGAPGFQSGVIESQFAPYKNYADLFKGWGSNQTTQYPQGSAAQGALGGALSGYALSRMFG